MRASEIRPKVGTVIEDNYDAQSLCRTKEWVSNVHETDDVLRVTYIRTQYYRPGCGSHDFYTDERPNDHSPRQCHWCHVAEDTLPPGDARWKQKCPVEQLHRHTSTQTSQKYLVFGGPKAGSRRLTEAEAGDEYVCYNRSSRWGKSDEIPKVVLIHVNMLRSRDATKAAKKAKKK